MHTTTSLLLTSLLTLTTSALPAHPQPNADQCGPTVPIPSDPKDTCHSAPIVLPHQDQFGITQTPVPSSLSVNNDWYICNPLADQLCEIMATAQANKWYFASAPAGACELGFWLPGGDDAAPNPALPGGRKDVTQCQNVYTAMINAVNVAPKSWLGATVNLLVPPAEQDAQFAPLPGGEGTGE